MPLRADTKGVLLHITSLYGGVIGSLSKSAYEFIDVLSESGQNYWQILPLNVIGEGNSPYSPLSSFANEPMLISIDFLTDCGLLKKGEAEKLPNTASTDYALAKSKKLPLVLKAAERINENDIDFLRFCNNNPDILNWCKVTENYSANLKAQYLFYIQWGQLVNYAHKKGIEIIGDLPFYVAENSADVKLNKKNFLLDEFGKPTLVAGVPPDYFSALGQLWGNPIYNFEYLKSTNYEFLINRICRALKNYDILRLDHFRAFADYYTVKYGSVSAQHGEWLPGPGADFFNVLYKKVNKNKIFAEDLGSESDALKRLIKTTNIKTMAVALFAAGGKSEYKKFLPENIKANTVAYTGTHDNRTVNGWYMSASTAERTFFGKKFGCGGTAAHSLISAVLKSRSDTVIIPAQDYLNLDDGALINRPGTKHGNWEWRMKKGDAEKLYKALIKPEFKR